ncbi:MAG: 30S ribosomal protein S16 [Bacteroidales bacterium]|nr:30S ribosomal protein S16 [Bacteroidales bacterium]
MPVKIRMQRRGRTHYAEFAIVAADTRSPRDGKFIEKLGKYNPNTNPATIELEFDRALYWVQQGAQMSDTARAILSHKGVLMFDHLLRGVKKGSFDETEANKRFEDWKNQKENQIRAKKEKLSATKQEIEEAALKAEKEVNLKRAEELRKRFAVEEETPEEVIEETTEVVETKPEEVAETKPEEKTEE